jgi:hypothetical protein
VFGCGRVLKTKIEVWRRVVGCQVGLRKYFIFPILPSQLIDGRKDTSCFIVIQGKLPQQMIVFRTDFIETVPTTERQMAVGV